MHIPNILQGFGLEIVLTAEMGYLWVRSLNNKKTETLRAFFRLCSALMLFLLVNIPVRISDLNLVKMNPFIVFMLNAFFIMFETLTAYEWFIYFLTVGETDPELIRKNKRLFTVPLIVMAVLLAVSYFTHWLYYVDEEGLYQRGSLFFLQFIIPYLYLAASLINALAEYRKNKNIRLFAIFSIAFTTSMIASVLQIFFSGSFTLAGLSLAVLLIYIEMYQYELKQIDNMKSLSAVNKQLESVNRQLSEAVRKLEISVENEKAANNAKNEFLSRMSHDIRTPLNGILGIIEINDRHPDDIAFQTENRRKARIATNHLVSLINDILDMSKLSSGKFELSDEPFRMPQLIDEVLVIATPNAEKHCVTLINENAGSYSDCPATSGSPLHIKRILLNIIGNAIKYNKKDGFVKVRLDYESAADEKIRYKVTVSDSGIGMSEDYLSKLFEPFSQEHIDARSVNNGSGLGMAITKALIDVMHGTIEVSSTVDVGSTFVIGLTFDIVKEANRAENEKSAADNLCGVRVLLVDDNELNIDIAQTLLEDVGASVDTAENGQIAYEKIMNSAAGTYDVILMDCMMPVMDGFEATKAIRKIGSEEARHIPIIAMTANAFSDDIKKCLDAGMNDHLAKPFEIGKVISTIRYYVSC